MNFDTILDDVSLLSPSMINGLEASAANPGPHLQDNSTTSLLRGLLSELFNFTRSDLFPDVAKAVEKAKLFFPDEQAQAAFQAALDQVAENCDGYQGILVITEGQLHNKLKAIITDRDDSGKSSFWSITDSQSHTWPYMKDMSHILNAAHKSPEGVNTYDQMLDALARLAMFIVIKANRLIPLNSTPDGAVFTFVVNIPDWTGEYLSFSALLASMVKLHGSVALQPVIRFCDAQGVYARALYATTHTWKVTLEDQKTEITQLNESIAALKEQASGSAPGLSWAL